MNLRPWAATVARVLRQLRRDPRTVVLLLGVPTGVMALLRWLYSGQLEAYQRAAPPLLVLIPFITMFLVTSVAMLRERTSGTLERLLTTPIAKLDIIVGYGTAFGLFALAQAGLATGVSVGFLDLELAGGTAALLVVATVGALFGTALGLTLSAFATSEFQAVQFLPAVVFPQLLLCGLIVPREALPEVLNAVSDALPLSYLVSAVRDVASSPEITGELVRDVTVVGGSALAALGLATVTLRRHSA